MKRAGLGLAFGAAALLSGCATGPLAAPSVASTEGMSGLVHGGQQPVTGATIQLYATTSGGYGGAPTLLGTTTTSSTGAFTFPNGTAATCPSGQQAYLLASGGNPGIVGTVNNTAILMAAALGPCTSLSSSTVISVDEVTTVAAAYALAGFAPAGGAGLIASTGAAMTAGFGTSPTNVQGLTDAFANANNIVSFNTGQAYAATPAAGSTGIVPQATINSLADILQDCVNTSSAGSTACTSLFTAAKPPSASGLSTPVNILQAALDIAQYPGANPAGLFSLISANAAFGPTLSAAPNDWTLGVTYTSSQLISGVGLGIDASDNVYVTGTPSGADNYLINFTAQGAPISSANLLAGNTSITSSDSLRQIAFDPTGNLFITDGATTGVYEYKPSNGSSTLLNFDVAPASVANANTYGIAVDKLGDVWTSSYSKATCASVTCPLVEFPSASFTTPTTSFSGFTAPQPTGALGGARGIAFDVNTGNIWITAIDDNLAEVFKVTPSATGAATATASPIQITGLGSEVGVPASNTAYGSISVAVDSTSRGWIVIAGGPATTKNVTAAVPAAIYPVTISGGAATVGTAVTGGGLTTPTAVVVDGNNNLFVANTGGSSVVEYSPAQAAFLSPASTGFIPSSTGTLYSPSYLEIDRSGAIWTLSSGNGTTHPANLIQILGVAAPTNPVLSAGQYGVKP
ncbi:hypothetical protein [Granulicella rosea]|uniref:hypothetical protein n=1 Tax=Granulicella rosea TaxID=474952 RepID=UPI000B77D0B3|nr:hypothetical protein [Granulicella rosea]